MASTDFDPDGLVQAKRLIDELADEVENEGAPPLDSRKLIRVLRILADQVEMLREA